MKSLRVKLSLFFISLLYISSICSFLLSGFLPNNSLNKEIKHNQQVIAISILELAQKTNLSIEEIIKITSNSMYNVRKVEEEQLTHISKDQFNRLQNQEVIFFSPILSGIGKTMLMVNDTYIKIELHHHNNFFKILISRLGITILSYVVIGTLLITLFGKRALKPILNLTEATQEVAKGNFDVRVNINSRDEIGILTKNFNRMTKKLKNIEYLRKDFITNVSHEFKTPIASIQGFAKLLNSSNVSEEEKQEYTEIIIEETMRLSRLSSNILNLSGLENQEEIEQTILFSLDEQIRRGILLLEHEWSSKNINLDIDLEEVKFQGDEEMLYQVWINLIQNAIKFSYDNGSIYIKLYQTGSIVKVKIKDTGIGMDEKTQKRIFEKFYQGDKSHSSEGNGLGLSIVKRILDLCNGSICVKSKPGEGSTFIVELPITSNIINIE